VTSALDPVARLPGLGRASAAALNEKGIRTVADLVWTPPSGWDDLRAPLPLAEAVAQAAGAGGAHRVVFTAIVESATIVPIRRRRSVRVVLRDAKDQTCKLHAFWFFMAHGILASAKPGEAVLVVGKVVVEKKTPPRSVHPDLVADRPETRRARPRYPRLGPSGAAVAKAIAHAVGEIASDLDFVPSSVAARERMPPAADLLRRIHALDGAVPSESDRRALAERLAWGEAFAAAWQRIVTEEGQGAAPAPRLLARPDAIARIERALGLSLTGDQRRACLEIEADLASSTPMRRLLFGDVGTGKTAVAFFAVAQAAGAGRQAVILAPTSVLAEQYRAAVRPLESLGVRVALVTAAMPPAERKRALGEIDLAVGTHALMSESVELPRLALVVVDEQQRLGVAQRLSLVRKGERPHLLTLSATPIPRTLALALRGDLTTSVLRERPAGRPPVLTKLVRASGDELGDVVEEVATVASSGERVFWIVPRIGNEDDEADEEPTTALGRTSALRRRLGDEAVAMLHGGLPIADRRAAMEAFRDGRASVLVGTTVLEVGVDVPEATLIVVEEASRFGLAQLHQLRGRVGRGDRPGTCILVDPLTSPGAEARLGALTRLSTGEEIAQADLALRGAGDLGGTRQHGDDVFAYLDPAEEHAWLGRIEPEVRALRASDEELSRPEHAVLGSLVRRWRDALVRRTEAG
jgi:ATP-dependent DNA helicase RecG